MTLCLCKECLWFMFRLGRNGEAMLCDNALAREIYTDEYADVKGFSKSVPVRWMAPEYLAGQTPSSASDIVSFYCSELLQYLFI